MKTSEVPQDHNPLLAGKVRKAMYALDETGHYTTVASDGWIVEEMVTRAAVEECQRLTLEARARVEAGISSSLEFHMYDRRMDETILAQTAHVWRWRLRRHLRAQPFARLSPAWIARYAKALDLASEDLVRLP